MPSAFGVQEKDDRPRLVPTDCSVSRPGLGDATQNDGELATRRRMRVRVPDTARKLDERRRGRCGWR